MLTSGEQKKYESKLKREYRLAKLKKYPIVAPFPKLMLIETTNMCNLACIYCKNPQMIRKQGFIEMEFYKDLVLQAKKAGVEELGLYTTGEPFLNKECPEHIRFAKQEGIDYVFISSNGTLCDENVAEAIIEAGLDSLKLTISGGTRESYFRTHQLDLFEKVLANLKTVNRLRKEKKSNLKLSVSCIQTKETVKEEQAFRTLIEPFVDALVFHHVSHLTGQMAEENRDLYVSGTNERRSGNPEHIPCGLLWNRVNVTYEGLLTLCCVDFEGALTYANLKEERLTGAWNNRTMQTWREKHLQNDLKGSVCGKCLES